MIYTFLHKRFTRNIKKYISKKSNILIAISSGQDSLCLLKLLYDCIHKEKNKIQAIYIDHQWKKDSKCHSTHILNIMKAINIPITIYQIQESTVSELESRKIRYKIFIKHAIKENCSEIITGHNKNDQIETFLYNIFRGTSLQGISNFTINKKINNKISILRPLLNFKKSEIAWFCRIFHLPIWSDITNYNFYIKRNRLRYEIMPYLSNYFNPKIENTLTDFIKFCQNDNEYIQENTIKLYIKSKHKKFISLNFRIINKQHSVLRKRVLRLYFYYNFHQQIDKEIIIKILELNYIQKSQILKIYNLGLEFYNGWLYTTFT